MKKNFSLLMLFALLAGLLGACSAATAKPDTTRTVSVSGSGEVYLVPDIA